MIDDYDIFLTVYNSHNIHDCDCLELSQWQYMTDDYDIFITVLNNHKTCDDYDNIFATVLSSHNDKTCDCLWQSQVSFMTDQKVGLKNHMICRLWLFCYCFRQT